MLCWLTMLWGCSAPTASLPASVVEVRITNPPSWWANQGYERLTPPVRLPSAEADTPQVEIWVRAPDRGLQLVEHPDGRWVLDWPGGTIADRVEFRGTGSSRHVVDVRGTRVGPDGVLHDHLYRPDRNGLFGYEWPADDLDARNRVRDHLVAVTGRASIAKKMDCTNCHTRLRRDNTVPKEHGIVNRGTDAVGWFTPSTVLYDQAPLETYGRHDPNIDDPTIDATCGDQPATTTDLRGVPRFSCANGRVPKAERTTLPADVCASRDWIHDRLSEADRARLPPRCP